jgi:serine/threonine protein kinase/formylglycine-generating enzyme required for sulfatase activity
MIENPYVGKVFAGVEIGEEIGRGGMGVVMLGKRRSDDATVAVKLLPANEARDSTYIERFEREARLLMQLRHPNILHVDNMGSADDGTYFIVMEFVDGQSVGDLIGMQGALPPDQSTAIIIDSCRGLVAAHKQSVIHRDIKPDNILLTSDGQVKLADFGLAKDTSDNVKLTITGQVMGTPAFMSPEQGKGNPADYRTDIYSLGVTFYFMLAGQRPFEGSSPIEVLLKHIKEPPPPLSDLMPGLPAGLYEIIDRMIAKEADDRVQSCEEIIEFLESLAAEQGWNAAPPASAPPVDNLDLTLDVGLGAMVREAVATDKTQITSGDARTVQNLQTEDLIGDTADSMVGRTIGGKYLVRSKLGVGGMGAVYLVRHIHLDQDYALKMLHPDLAANTSFRERFLREAKAATAFTHKHAIQIRDFGQEEDMLYMSMDFSRGHTLKHVLAKEGVLSEMRTAVIAQQVLSALVEAHGAGLIHRDLKPDNVMMELRRGKDYVRILDFGVAKIMEDASQQKLDEESPLTRTGTVVGTVQYMSPEQASGASDIDPRSDLYSLSSILYECLTGSRPIQAENMQQMIYKLATEKAVPISRRVKGVSRKLGDLIMRNLSRDRGRRSDSAQEFLAELEACSDHLHSTIAVRRRGPGLLLPVIIGSAVAAAVAVLLLLVLDPFSKTAPGPGTTPGVGPVTAPGPGQPSPEDMTAEKKKLYDKYKALGDEAFSKGLWSPALDAYRKAWDVRQSDEIDLCLKKTKWQIHLLAYLKARKEKDYRKALGEVTYELLKVHTNIDEQRKAVAWEKELIALVEEAEILFATARKEDGKKRYLRALPLYETYIADFPRDIHIEEATKRHKAIKAILDKFKGLVVLSGQVDAEVILDGVSIGHTPCMYDGITPGRHEILIDAQGYLPLKRLVTYVKGRQLLLKETLESEHFGAIRVLSKGSVMIRWKGRSMGMTPVLLERIPAGEHFLEAVGKGDLTYLVKVEVEDGKTVRLEVDMDALAAAEKKAFATLARGKTMASTREIHEAFLKAYPRGQYGGAVRKILAGLAEEEDAYRTCCEANNGETLIQACRDYLLNYENQTYPQGWFVEEVKGKMALVIAARDKTAFEAIAAAKTFATKRRAMERYLDAFPRGPHADQVKSLRQALDAEETLYVQFSKAALFGKKITHGRRYLRIHPKGMMAVNVRKALEIMTAEEEGFFRPLTTIRDVDRLVTKCRSYLINFPGSDMSVEVEKRLRAAEQEQRMFLRTKEGPDHCRAYLDAYPKGWYRASVTERLARFGWTGDEVGRFGLQGQTPEGITRGKKPGEYRCRWDKAAMIYVPAGYFPLGTNDYYAEEEDGPEVMVYISAFFLDRYEVTNRQYRLFLTWCKKTKTPRKYSHPAEPKGINHTPALWKDSRFNKPDQPVVGVSWFNAYAYARWAGKLLPTEAQWEKAACANILKRTKSRFPWGDSPPAVGMCNGDGRLDATVTVASLPRGASPFGAEQMSGNVSEWCLDVFLKNALERLAARYPRNSGRYVKNPFHSKGSTRHSVRGGSFADGVDRLSATRRRGFKGQDRTVGFRCAMWKGK